MLINKVIQNNVLDEDGGTIHLYLSKPNSAALANHTWQRTSHARHSEALRYHGDHIHSVWQRNSGVGAYVASSSTWSALSRRGSVASSGIVVVGLFIRSDFAGGVCGIVFGIGGGIWLLIILLLG